MEMSEKRKICLRLFIQVFEKPNLDEFVEGLQYCSFSSSHEILRREQKVVDSGLFVVREQEPREAGLGASTAGSHHTCIRTEEGPPNTTMDRSGAGVPSAIHL